MSVFRRFCSWAFSLFSKWDFYYMFFTSLCANLLALVYYNELLPFMGMLSLSAFFAALGVFIINAVNNKIWHRVWFAIFAILNNIFILVDGFLFFTFKKIFSEDIIDIIADTNTQETSEFLSNYLSFTNILIGIVGLVALNAVIIFVSKWLSKCRIHKALSWAGVSLAIVGAYFACRCVVMFALFRNGEGIPQYTALTRSTYSAYVLNNKIKGIKATQIANANVLKGKPIPHLISNTNIILVIGESYSKYHSSLYGYEKNTNPGLSKRIDNGEMVIFNDAVTISDHTNGVMGSVFSLSKGVESLNGDILFPAIFKAAGFKTALYDNQYFVGNGISFLSDAELSKTVFDDRNDSKARYDLDIVNMMGLGKDSANHLIVYHLMGQHYTYADRYPEKFAKFKASDYTVPADMDKRQIVAHYDNATLYNDYVMDNLMKNNSDKKAIIIYFSDHGEEIFDQGDYMGHGNATVSKDMRYQMSVPMMIWASESYRKENAEQWQKIQHASTLPVFTDDISHLLIDLAGIKTEYLDETRSFINDKYDKSRHRIVLHSIDYDANKK